MDRDNDAQVTIDEFAEHYFATMTRIQEDIEDLESRVKDIEVR